MLDGSLGLSGSGVGRPASAQTEGLRAVVFFPASICAIKLSLALYKINATHNSVTHLFSCASTYGESQYAHAHPRVSTHRLRAAGPGASRGGAAVAQKQDDLAEKGPYSQRAFARKIGPAVQPVVTHLELNISGVCIR